MEANPDSAAVRPCGTNIYYGNPVPGNVVSAIGELEKLLEMDIWLYVQNGDSQWDEVSERVYCGFRDKRSEIVSGRRVGLLIHSPGGSANAAYKTARLFQRRTEEFYTLVPLYAKSAATLMALGGKSIIMGSEGELGPLDVQLYDHDKENYDSALNAVQSLERLNAYALNAFDQAMMLFTQRTRKKPDSLMPLGIEYATQIVRPLIEKIDTIDLSRRSRELKVAEDYAIRLMRANYQQKDYIRIASNLVERYCSHDFYIDRDEAGREGATPQMTLNLGLNIQVPEKRVEELFSELMVFLETATALGRITEITP